MLISRTSTCSLYVLLSFPTLVWMEIEARCKRQIRSDTENKKSIVVVMGNDFSSCLQCALQLVVGSQPVVCVQQDAEARVLMCV